LGVQGVNGSPVPEFDSDDDRSYYLVRLPAHPRAKTAGQEAGEVTGEATSTGQVTGQVIGQVTGHADSWILDVLRACRFLPLKSSEIQALTGIKHRETFQRNYLDRLIKEDWIERTIPDKPTSRLQKYCLTEKGRKILENP
jgi:DNA-binding HxlR family transcriptional regulator